MNVTGIEFIRNKPYLLTERFHSIEPLPATAGEIRLAIDEALNHLDALHQALALFPESDSIVEQDRLIDAYLASKSK